MSELADFFASAPARAQIIAFKSSDAVGQGARELLELNHAGTLADDQREELDQL